MKNICLASEEDVSCVKRTIEGGAEVIQVGFFNSLFTLKASSPELSEKNSNFSVLKIEKISTTIFDLKNL